MKNEKELISHYDSNPDYWSPINNQSVDNIMNRLDVELSKDSKVIDIGCGDGRLLRLLYDKYKLFGFGIDYSSVRIEKAINLSKGDLTYICREIQDTSGLDNFIWDYGFMFEVLEHLEDPKGVLDTYRNICGKVVGSVPIQMPYKAHIQVFESVEDVEKMLNVNVIFKHGKQAYFTT